MLEKTQILLQVSIGVFYFNTAYILKIYHLNLFVFEWLPVHLDTGFGDMSCVNLYQGQLIYLANTVQSCVAQDSWRL